MLNSSKTTKGFTLIEIIVGIVVLGVALMVITSALGPLYQRSADPWHQVRAAELGHSLLNEIMARSFDENSDRAGGEFRCGELNAPACTPCGALGTEGESRSGFNDVDDFNELQLGGSDIVGSTGNLALDNLYVGYTSYVTINCAGGDLGLANDSVKKVTVTITTPTGEALAFSAYRSNW